MNNWFGLAEIRWNIDSMAGRKQLICSLIATHFLFDCLLFFYNRNFIHLSSFNLPSLSLEVSFLFFL